MTLRNSRMTQRSMKWLAFVGALLLLDLALTVHTALTWTAQPEGPTLMPAGEAIGWFTSLMLAVWAALIIIGAIRPARSRGWTDPTRQDRMTPHKPVNINRSQPSGKP